MSKNRNEFYIETFISENVPLCGMTKKVGAIAAVLILIVLLIAVFYYLITSGAMGKTMPTLTQEKECWEPLIVDEQGTNIQCDSVNDCIDAFKEKGIDNEQAFSKLRCNSDICEYKEDCAYLEQGIKFH